MGILIGKIYEFNCDAKGTKERHILTSGEYMTRQPIASSPAPEPKDAEGRSLPSLLPTRIAWMPLSHLTWRPNT